MTEDDFIDKATAYLLVFLAGFILGWLTGCHDGHRPPDKPLMMRQKQVQFQQASKRQVIRPMPRGLYLFSLPGAL